MLLTTLVGCDRCIEECGPGGWYATCETTLDCACLVQLEEEWEGINRYPCANAALQPESSEFWRLDCHEPHADGSPFCTTICSSDDQCAGNGHCDTDLKLCVRGAEDADDPTDTQ